VIAKIPDTATRTGGVEETRARILAATRDLYSRLGSRGTTTREVADRAGVNEATLFRHFGTKSQLISAMLDVYCHQSQYPEVIAKLEGPLERDLTELMRVGIENLLRKEALIKVGMAEEFTNPDGGESAFRGPIEARRHLIAYFRDRVAGGELRGKPEDLARVFMSLAFAYVMGRRMWEEYENTESELVVPILIDYFLNGARAS
jgi:AcrR family transcriptional regulator